MDLFRERRQKDRGRGRDYDFGGGDPSGFETGRPLRRTGDMRKVPCKDKWRSGKSLSGESERDGRRTSLSGNYG